MVLLLHISNYHFLYWMLILYLNVTIVLTMIWMLWSNTKELIQNSPTSSCSGNSHSNKQMLDHSSSAKRVFNDMMDSSSSLYLEWASKKHCCNQKGRFDLWYPTHTWKVFYWFTFWVWLLAFNIIKTFCITTDICINIQCTVYANHKCALAYLPYFIPKF